MNNYIPASPLSYIGHHKNSNVNIQEEVSFLEKNTLGLLHCVAEDVSNTKQMQTFNKRVDHSLDKLEIYTKTIPLYIDSGGFQVLLGKYSIEDVEKLSEVYYDYLKNNPDRYDRAFVLDLPPNDFCFKNWDDVRQWNQKTYKIAADMNDDKNIFVFHMLNIQSYRIWTELFDQYHDKFNMFGVGGIAIKQYGNMNRIISYSVPFKTYLEKCLQYNMKEIDIHFLGAGQASTVLTFLFALVKEFIKDEYQISFNIQSDSCPHQKLARARVFMALENETIHKLTYFSKHLKSNFMGKTLETYILDKLNKFADENGFSVHANSIYQDNGKQNMDCYVLMTMYDLLVYKEIQEIINKKVSGILRYYLNGETELFYNKCIDFLQRLNGGKLTKNLRNDTVNLIKFLDIMRDKNLNRVEMLLKQNATALFQTDSLLKL